MISLNHTFDQIIHEATQILNKDGLIIYPTDTVWGLGCNAASDGAVQKLFVLKNKPKGNGLIVLFPNWKIAQQYTDFDLSSIKPNTVRPTSYIVPQGKNVSDLVLAEDGTLAFRIPNDSFCISLLQSVNFPIISTSANIHGEPTANRFDELDPNLTDQVDWVSPRLFENHKEVQASRIIKIQADGTPLIIRE